MKVVALVSGGKDSCYVMLKCLSYGHDVIALAHITPPGAVVEADSYMYQSVGSSAVEAMAQALDLPLYTREGSGRAVVTTLAYTPRDPTDEVEDLYSLLRTVKAHHADVAAVCAGALWSDYQRLRVESAAARAGLLSLAYLWRRDQRQLLDEMIASGMRAVLVKVAAVGLGEADLGKSLQELRGKLVRLDERYGVHVCGEGGEFETIVLSLPTFTHDLVIADPRVVRHADDAIAPVMLLDFASVNLVPKSPQAVGFTALLPPVPPVPPALCPLAEGDVFPLPKPAWLESPEVDAVVAAVNAEAADDDDAESPEVSVSSKLVNGYAHVVARTPLAGGDGVRDAVCALRETLRKLAAHAPFPGCEEPLADVLYVWLRLGSLSADDYAAANGAYAGAFGSAACNPPPARACVGMRGGSAVVLEALARLGRRRDPDTVTLHVQSISEWAPPCIGPYAQAVEDRGVVHVCGVVPLHAPTASVPAGLGARAQTRACLHNMRRTLEATNTCMDRLAFVVAYVVREELATAVELELRTRLSSFVGPLAIVPVHELPKDALVEVRAVAPAGETPSENTSLTRAAVGPMLYRVLECVSTSVLGAVNEIVEAIRHLEMLSVQVFCLRELYVDLQEELLDYQFSHATLVAPADWLAHNATALCILTAVESTPPNLGIAA